VTIIIQIEKYTETQASTWDEFVRRSKNGTFLFLRDYMDYHRERYQDHSLLIRDDDGRLIALLPANRNGSALISHSGLTYGGFVIDESMKTPRMLEMFDAVLTSLQQAGLTRFVYKTIPPIYHRLPAEEDRYALFLCNASVIRRGVLTVIDTHCRLPFQERRNRGVKKAQRAGLTIARSDDFAIYWDILTDRLLKTHNTLPVHALSEIESLRFQFPDNIKLFACFQDSGMLGGVLIYESERVAHVQYIAASDQGRELGALDLLFHDLLTEHYASKPIFDFGTSDEDNGRHLNRGLIDQKEGFGARAIVHDHYEISLVDWRPGQIVGAIV